MSTCRTDAATASRTASGSRPARLRCVRPGRCRASPRDARSPRPGRRGSPGTARGSRRRSSAAKRTSSSARRFSSRSRRRARTSASERHSCSARSIASGSARMPWRSYRLRDRLHRTTTAESRLARLRPPGQRGITGRQEDEMPRSAQSRHSGPGSSMNSRSPVPPHDVHVHSLIGEITTRSGGRLCRSIVALGQVWRHPVCAVRALDGGIPADTEPQLAAVASAGDVLGLRRVEPPVLRPALERRQRSCDLARVRPARRSRATRSGPAATGRYATALTTRGRRAHRWC